MGSFWLPTSCFALQHKLEYSILGILPGPVRGKYYSLGLLKIIDVGVIGDNK